MTSILVAGSFTDPSLPTDVDMKTYLSQQASLRYWLQADEEHCSISGGTVTSFNDVRASSLRKFTQATVGSQVPVAADSTIQGYTSASFSGTKNYAYNEAFDTSGTFTIAALVRPAADAQITILSNRTADTVQTTLYTSSDRQFRMLHRGAQSVSGVILPTTTPSLVFGVGSPTNVKTAVNSGAPVVVAASGTESVGTMYVSRLGTASSNYWNGAISDIMVFDLDLYAPENASLLTDVKTYFSETYNLTL